MRVHICAYMYVCLRVYMRMYLKVHKHFAYKVYNTQIVPKYLDILNDYNSHVNNDRILYFTEIGAV